MRKYNTKDVAKACAQAAHEAIRVHAALIGADVPPHWMAHGAGAIREGAVAWTASILLHGGVEAAHRVLETQQPGTIEPWLESAPGYRQEMLMTEKVIFAVAESLGLTQEVIAASVAQAEKEST